MAKQWRAQIHEEPSFGAPYPFAKVVQSMQGEKQGEEENRVKKIEDKQLQSSCALLEHLPKSIFYMLYTISKLRKSRIQRFKSCVIWSWNEEVTSFGRWLLQAEGRIQQSVAKSAFCCENFAAFLYSAMEFLLKLPDTCRKLERWEPQGGSQFRSPASLTCCCENTSQPSWVSAKSRRHHFSPAKWFLKLPDICYRHWEIFSIRFLLSKSQNTPCKPPITRFLSF